MSDRTVVVVVAGAGGFIGGHLVRELLGTSHRVVAVDSMPLQAPSSTEWQTSFSARSATTFSLSPST